MPTSDLSKFAHWTCKKPNLDKIGEKLLESGYRYLQDIPASEIAHGDLIHIYDIANRTYSTGLVARYHEGDHLDYKIVSPGTATWAMTLMSASTKAHLIKVIAKGIY